MDPAAYCVYNATRNALLSERVISVSDPQTPAQLLALVLNGPGRDPHFCIRLNNVSVAPEIPRLFAFDVAYLDSEQRIIATADVGPATPFPPITDQVTTILFLSDQLLAQSNSEPGDIIRICTGAELAVLLRAAAQFNEIESPAHRFESAIPQTTPDPFDGSLIYLPSSGTPQTREIFLPPSQQSKQSDSFAQVTVNLSNPAGKVSANPAPAVLDIPNLSNDAEPVSELQTQPNLSEIPSPVRFFENPASTNHSSEPHSSETKQPTAPRLSELPFNLRAVIQLVDEQLRREQQHDGEPSNLEQPSWLSGRMQFNQSSIVTAEIADVLPTPEQPHPASLEPAPAVTTHPFTNEASEPAQINASTLADTPTVSAPEPQHSEPPRRIAPANTSEAVSASPPQLTSPPVLQDAQTPASALATEPATQAQPSPLQLPPRPPAKTRKVVKSPLEQPLPISHQRERTLPIPAKEKLPFASRVQRWLSGESVSLSGNRRRGERVVLPGLVAFYFTGGAPKPHEIVNISSSGLYLRSKELWSPNTLVRMTLERDDPAGAEKRSISVLARVVRVDEGGIAHEFVTTEVLARLHARDFLPSQGTNRKELDKFLASPK